MTFKTLRDFDLQGKRVLLRVDLNVPVQNGKVTDTTRIDRLKPTIDYLVAQGAKTLILSHFGRPKGISDPALSLSFLPETLKLQWGIDVAFGEEANGPLTLLENLRFHKGEESNDPAFAQTLAQKGDIYINDAFSVSHRAHASTEGLAHLLPAGAGFLMEEELNTLNTMLENPKRPLAAIVGGTKISTKLALLENLLEKTDMLVLGGGMANTFLYAQNTDIKASICEKDMAEQARKIIEKAKCSGCELLLPVDGLAAIALKENIDHVTCDIGNLPDDHMILDIGPKSVEILQHRLQDCKTIIWNGPVGAFEIEPFDTGTTALARFVATLTKQGKVQAIAGGGDTVAALEKAGVTSDFTYISTAGGAFLEWMEGKTLPGVAALLSPGHDTNSIRQGCC